MVLSTVRGRPLDRDGAFRPSDDLDVNLDRLLALPNPCPGRLWLRCTGHGLVIKGELLRVEGVVLVAAHDAV